jgi:hypothetical protein
VAGLAGQSVRGYPFRLILLPAEPAGAPASSFVPPHVTADTRRPSSRLDRHVSGPSGDGSEAMIACGLGGVEKVGGFSRDSCNQRHPNACRAQINSHER